MDNFITIAQARERLGISKTKMAALIKGGKIATHENALDARSKLIRVEDLEAFISGGAVASQRKKKPSQDTTPAQPPQRRQVTATPTMPTS